MAVNQVRRGKPAATATFSSLRYPSYRRLWISGLVVFLAVTAQAIARGWLALELTGTNAGLGGVLLGFGFAMLLATPFGGVAADRLPKRTVIFMAQLLLTISAGWIGFAVQFDFVAYWMLIAASALQAVAFALYGPARMAYISELVDDEDRPNAIVIGQMSAEAMRIVGPSAAGVLIGAATWGLAGVFQGCAVLCAAGTIIGLTLPKAEPRSGRPTRSPLGDLRDGIDYVRREPGLALLVSTSLAVVMLGYPYMGFLPTVADGIFDAGSSGYGIMSAVGAGGAVLAGLFNVRRGTRADPWQVVTVSGFGFGTGIILLGLAPSFPVALGLLVLIGGSSLSFQTTLQSLLLGLSHFEYHGRIQSLVMLGFSGFGIAALPLGIVADAIGLRTTFVMMGIGMDLVLVSFVLRRRRFRNRELALEIG